MRNPRWHALLVSGALFLGIAGAGRAAHAEPTEAEKRAAAQGLFDAARALSTQEKYGEACPKLLESYRLDPAIGTKFYLAECYEHIGKLASAWTYYLEVVDDARRSGAKDREKFAGQRADALKPRLSQLRVKRSAGEAGTAGLAVERDGLPVGEGMWDTPIAVDLGAHVVRATAPGKKPLELHVELKQEGAELVVEIPPLDELPAPPPVDAPPPPPPEPPPKPVSPAQRNAGFAVGAVGVVGLGVGIGFGVMAISRKNASNAPGFCDANDVCTMAGQQLRIDGVHAATASTALIVVGGAALGTGIVLIATAPSPGPKRDLAPSAHLSLGPLGASLTTRF